MTGTVSTASIIGMAVTMIISIGLPIFLLVFVKKKTNGKLGWALIGGLTFILFALVLESLFHNFVIGELGEKVTGNVWFLALYGGLAAGIFEETGRFLAMKNIKKGTLHKDNAIMYGIGHGGIESILLIGLTYISNLVTAAMINSGMMETSLSMLEGNLKDQAASQLQSLCDLPAYTFYLAGVERMSTIVLHICLSYIVYKAVKDSKPVFFVIAIALHAFVDGVIVILNNMFGVWAAEIVLIAEVAFIAVFCYKDYSRLEETIEA